MNLKIYIVSEDYMDFLRNVENRIPRQYYVDSNNSSKRKFKPFIGIVFTTPDGIKYCTQISSPKDRHKNLSETIDFKKYYLTDSSGNQKLTGVINLNYMFPVNDLVITELTYQYLSVVRDFDSEKEKSKYWKFLMHQLNAINALDWTSDIEDVYYYRNSVVAKRSLDFKFLEQKCKEWEDSHKS